MSGEAWDFLKDVGRKLLHPTTPEELMADHAKILSRLPHHPDCSSEVPFSPGQCDCPRKEGVARLSRYFQDLVASLEKE